MKKAMKKAITMLIVAMSIITLAIPAAASDYECFEHEHAWDIVNWGTETDMICDCGTVVTIPHDSLFCLHEMVEFQHSRTHGTECLYCGFTVSAKHSWEFDDEYSEFGEYYHDAWCTECGYERTHSLISYHNDTEHILVCNRCDVRIHHELAYEPANRYCHEVACNSCDYIFYEAHNLNEENVCVECELLTGMVTGQHTVFDEDGTPLENQYYVLVDGEEEVFVIDEYFDDITLGDIITFITDGYYIDEIVDVVSLDEIDENDIFFIEDEDDIEWLWWNDFHAVNYIASTSEFTFNVELGDEIVIITPENPLQHTIYYIVN